MKSPLQQATVPAICTSQGSLCLYLPNNFSEMFSFLYCQGLGHRREFRTLGDGPVFQAYMLNGCRGSILAYFCTQMHTHIHAPMKPAQMILKAMTGWGEGSFFFAEERELEERMFVELELGKFMLSHKLV